MVDVSKKYFIWTIVGLILLRVILVVLMMNNIPFTDMQLGGFRPNFTTSYMSDEQKFFDIGKGLASGKIVPSPSNFGYGLFLAPFIYFLKAENTVQIAKSIFIAQEFFLWPLALILVAAIAVYLFNSRFWAMACAALFTVYPWLLLVFGNAIGYRNAVPGFHHQLWIIIQSDYISALFVYLSFFLVFKWFDDLFKSSSIKYPKLFYLGFSSGAALLVKMTNIWLILIIWGVFIYFKSFKNAAIYSAFLALIYTPQLFYNAFAFGAPWIYGYKPYGFTKGLFSEQFNITNLWRNFYNFSPNYYLLLFFATTIFFCFIFFAGRKYFLAINNIFLNIISAWFWSYLIFFGIFAYTLQSLRYFLPAMPVFIYFFVASVIFLFGQVHSRIQRIL
jgi:hypothetical protein